MRNPHGIDRSSRLTLIDAADGRLRARLCPKIVAAVTQGRHTPMEAFMDIPDRDVHVLVLGASLSSTSLNNRLAALAAKLVSRKGGTVDLVQIGEFDCPYYDSDIEVEVGPPLGAHRFCERLKVSDALIVASPEYNSSMPATIKNLIDWGSRFRPQPFNGRHALLLSASPSMVGGNRGLWALRVPFEHLGTRVYPDMFSLAQAHQAFTPDGHLKDPEVETRLDRTLGCFLDLVEATKHYARLKKVWVEFLGEHPSAATDRIEESEIAAA